MKPEPVPDLQGAVAILSGAVAQIQCARNYTLELLNATPVESWFQIPEGYPSHVAWQVGHLAVSQYGLLMFQIRGRQTQDLEIIPGRFRKAYSRGSRPNPDSEGQMTPDELLERLHTIHERSLAEIRATSPETLLEPVGMPYVGWPVKLGAVLFCPLHEQIHAGQIGLLRRGLGLDPVR